MRCDVTRVDFYILKSDAARARLKLACRIAEKAMLKDRHVFIHTDETHEAQQLDEMLWTFSQNSFVPHKVIDNADGASTAEPVLIGTSIEPSGNTWDTLINLAAEVPEFFSRYERVAEVVDGESNRRNDGRERFRYYRDRGYQLNTHEIE